jgi:hypothetical protein
MRSSRKTDLPSALLGTARAAVLRVLLDDQQTPAAGLHLREIARRTSLAVATVQRELKLLVSLGLVDRSSANQQVLFTPRADASSLGALRALLGIATDPHAELKSMLRSFGPRVESAWLIESPSSPFPAALKLIVVGTASFEDVFARLEPIERAMGRSIELQSFTSDGFSRHRGRYALESATRLVGDDSLR